MIGFGADHILPFSLILGGITSLVAMPVWIALGLDERILNLFAPRPQVGSLTYNDFIPDITVRVQPSGERLADISFQLKLKNRTQHLFRTDTKLSVQINGTEGPSVQFGGYAPHDEVSSSYLWARDVHLPIEAGALVLDYQFKYNVNYSYAHSPRRKRKTTKVISPQHTLLPLTGGPGANVVNTHFNFSSEEDE